MIEYLILQNALEVAGVDPDTGELLYAITSKMKDVMPDIYNEHMTYINREVMALWEKGYLEIDFLHDEQTVSLSEKAMVPEEVSKLSNKEQWSLNEFKRVLREK